MSIACLSRDDLQPALGKENFAVPITPRGFTTEGIGDRCFVDSLRGLEQGVEQDRPNDATITASGSKRGKRPGAKADQDESFAAP